MTSEDAIRVAPEKGALCYEPTTPHFEGDRGGPVPAGFPKGTRAFYTMKYEVRQGQYAELLDMLSDNATFFRAPFAGRGYEEGRGTIRRHGEGYVAASPHRPANFISWDDGAAFADWMGLRPMTELEFTKAARGPDDPAAGDYPWAPRRRSGCCAAWAPTTTSSGQARPTRRRSPTRLATDCGRPMGRAWGVGGWRVSGLPSSPPIPRPVTGPERLQSHPPPRRQGGSHDAPTHPRQ